MPRKTTIKQPFKTIVVGKLFTSFQKHQETLTMENHSANLLVLVVYPHLKYHRAKCVSELFRF